MPVALTIHGDTPCPECGYNLRGLRLDSRCPECGRPTADTFARPVRAIDGTLAMDLLSRGGQVLGVLVVASIVQRLVPIAGPAALPEGVLGGLLVALAAVRVGRRMRKDLALARHFRPTRTLREVATPVALLYFGALLAAVASAAMLEQPLLAGVLVLGGVILAAAGQFVAGNAVTRMLRQTSQSQTVKYGAPVLTAAALLMAPAVAVLPGATWTIVLGQLGLLAVLAMTWWTTWRRYDRAVGRAQGPVSSL